MPLVWETSPLAQIRSQFVKFRTVLWRPSFISSFKSVHFRTEKEVCLFSCLLAKRLEMSFPACSNCAQMHKVEPCFECNKPLCYECLSVHYNDWKIHKIEKSEAAINSLIHCKEKLGKALQVGFFSIFDSGFIQSDFSIQTRWTLCSRRIKMSFLWRRRRSRRPTTPCYRDLTKKRNRLIGISTGWLATSKITFYISRVLTWTEGLGRF